LTANEERYEKSLSSGTEIIKTMGEALYKNTYIVFDEILSNAYDADATKIEIETSPDKILFKDNGEGMDDKELDLFLKFGSSHKLDKATSNRLNRRLIGKFGIGKLSMSVICDECHICTVKNSTKLELKLNFPEILGYEKLEDVKIPIGKSKTDLPSGTLIELTKLKKRFKEDVIVNRIAKTMPAVPDFKIFFNDMELSQEEFMKGEKYDFEISVPPLLNNIRGTFWHSNKSLGKKAGIYIRVNKRTVNVDDPHCLDLISYISHPGSYRSRIRGIIDADELNDVLLATRAGFKEDSEKFSEFKKAILKELRTFVKKIEKHRNEEMNKHIRNKLEDTVTFNLQRALKVNRNVAQGKFPASFREEARNSEGLKKIEMVRARETEKEFSGSGTLSTQATDKGKVFFPRRAALSIGSTRYYFEVLPLGEKTKACVIDPNKKAIYLNGDHQQFKLAVKEKSLSSFFRYSIIHEMAVALSEGSLDKFSKIYEDFLQQKQVFIEGDKLLRGKNG